MKITSDVHIFDDFLDFTYSLVHILTIFFKSMYFRAFLLTAVHPKTSASESSFPGRRI